MRHGIEQCTGADFPPLLSEIPDPPERLYIRGTYPLTEEKRLTIVGSRAYTGYGKEAVDYLVDGLAGYPVTIVSGLALGIDSLAHRAALRAGLNTVAVPGSGLSDRVIYPRAHQRLAHDILDAGGTLLSEFEPDFRATPWGFPRRNRILAGLSHATLVVEATQRSGTLITARLATEYNRDVLTIPHQIFSENGTGPHLLMSLGATPIRTPDDILAALDIKKDDETVEKIDITTLPDPEQILLHALRTPCSRNELMQHTPLDTTTCIITLSTLELKQYIKESGGYIYKLI